MKIIYMPTEVTWKLLYSTFSGLDTFMLYQLRNLINRRNVIKEPNNNVAECEDFILLVTEAHVLADAMTHFNMKSLDDVPSAVLIRDLCSLDRRNIFIKATHSLVDNFVDVSFFKEDNEELSLSPANNLVRAYACSVLTNGLLLMEFNDAIREGDGDCILRCWSYFMIIFKSTDRRNYCIGASNMLVQYHFIFPSKLAAQFK